MDQYYPIKYDEWIGGLSSQLGIDCSQFNILFKKTKFYAHLCKTRNVNSLSDTCCFVVLMIQIQKVKKTMPYPYEIMISPWPAITEVWKNRYDDPKQWDKSKNDNKWINLYTIGPFDDPGQAREFQKALSNLTRASNTTIVKAQSVVQAYNLHLDECKRIKIYVYPKCHDEHFILDHMNGGVDHTEDAICVYLFDPFLD